MTRIDPLIARRKPRLGPDWHEGTSHIGGLPALDHQPWPRSPQGQPLHFLAQIDLADITPLRPGTGLPETGYLLFFADTYTNDSAVLHVPANAVLSEPPADTPPLHGMENFSYVYKFAPTAETAPRLKPRWPLSFHPALHEDGEEELGVAAAEVANSLGRVTDARIDLIKAFVATAYPEDQKRKFHGLKWNHSIHLYADSIIGELNDLPRALKYLGERMKKGEAFRESLLTRPTRLQRLFFGAQPTYKSEDAKEKFEASLKATEREMDTLDTQQALVPDFHAFASELADWADSLNPWDEITEQDYDRLVAYTEKRRTTFKRFYTSRYSPYALDWIARDTLKHMITGPDNLWHLLPEAFRDYINTKELFPWDAAGWHQVFGRGRDIQGGVYSYSGDTLLLQLTHDDLIYLDQGDVGAMTFWLRHQDLIDRRWERADMLFECS